MCTEPSPPPCTSLHPPSSPLHPPAECTAADQHVVTQPPVVIATADPVVDKAPVVRLGARVEHTGAERGHDERLSSGGGERGRVQGRAAVGGGVNEVGDPKL